MAIDLVNLKLVEVDCTFSFNPNAPTDSHSTELAYYQVIVELPMTMQLFHEKDLKLCTYDEFINRLGGPEGEGQTHTSRKTKISRSFSFA